MKATATSPSACMPSPRVTAFRTSVRTLSLKEREVHSFDLLESERCSLRIHEGVAWATLEGDPTDHVLIASSCTGFTGPGRLVIEAVGGDLALQMVSVTLPG